MEKKIKHLEFIQSSIARVSNNSFLLKGWAITILVALFALDIKSPNKGFFLASFSVILLFWFLDAFYLSSERKFRFLYNNVRIKDESEIDFDLSIRHIREKSCRWLSCSFSKTLIIFYGAALILFGIIYILY